MSFTMNPVLSEIQGLSPAAQAALGMAGHTLAPATNPPAITPDMKAAAQPVDAGPPPEMKPMTMPGSDPVPHLGIPAAPDASSPIRGTLPGDQLYRQHLLQTGSGESQIAHRIEGTGFGQNHPLAGKILGGLAQGAATLGDIGLSAVAPGIAMNLPGTAYHHQGDLRRADTAVAQDEANAGKEAQTRAENAGAEHTEAETPTVAPLAASKEALDTSEIAEHNAQVSALLHPQAKTDFEAWQKQNPGHPIAEWLQLQANSKPVTTEHVNLMGPDGKTPIAGNYNPKTHEYTDASGKVIANPSPYEKPQQVNVNAGDASLDRLAARLGKPYQAGFDASGKQLDNIEKTMRSIDSGYKGQALALPETMTALVSGQGTGVRITQAELNAIGQHNGIKGDVESFFNRISGEGSMTDEDKKQLKAILSDVRQRISEKQQIHKEALDSINGAADRGAVSQADALGRQKLSDLEQHGHFVGQTVHLKNGKDVVVQKVHPDGSFD